MGYIVHVTASFICPDCQNKFVVKIEDLEKLENRISKNCQYTYRFQVNCP